MGSPIYACGELVSTLPTKRNSASSSCYSIFRMLPSSGRSIGEQSVTTLPANRSIILADSRFRPTGPNDTPYNFNCDLSGTAIYAKEIFYQKLFWNQPLFAHNNASCELRFAMQGYQMDSTIVFIVYVTPFVMFTQYDGNRVGSSFLTPQLYSYASNIELGLNTDLRTYPLNTTPYQLTGAMRDSAGNVINMNFRYTPSRGFAMFASPTVVDRVTRYYGIEILPCSFIQNGHFVHGMGIFNDHIDPTIYTPHNFFLSTVFSDCAPNLLPMRYIVVQSQELNKDRRMISFHNGNFSSFVNELAIFAVNPIRTGVFHEVGVGDDATVISLRDDYTPQSFRIQILDERGVVLSASDPLSALLQSTGVDQYVLQSYITGTQAGRGNTDFINFLVFGYQRVFNGVSSLVTNALNVTAAWPGSGGMGGANLYSQPLPSTDVFSHLIELPSCIAVSSSTSFSITPPQATGFGPTVVPHNPFLNNAALYGYFSAFTWYPSINANPYVQIDSQFTSWMGDLNVPSTSGGQGYYVLVMFDALTFTIIQTSNLYGYSLSNTPIRNFSPYNATAWNLNPFYVFPPAPASVQVGFAFAYVVVQVPAAPPYQAHFVDMYTGGTISGNLSIANNFETLNVQTEYLPPVIETGDYIFGDPLAQALEEEVLHEIASVLEYN